VKTKLYLKCSHIDDKRKPLRDGISENDDDDEGGDEWKNF
jgi:hypothetical protein